MLGNATNDEVCLEKAKLIHSNRSEMVKINITNKLDQCHYTDKDDQELTSNLD